MGQPAMGKHERCKHWWNLLKLMLAYLGCFVVVVVDAHTALNKCRFPQEWKGRYYQSGLGEIVIRDSQITTKGTCVEQSRDYFLLDNRENSCFHCLLLLHQHKNVIQYKESYCTAQSDLKTVCGQIKVETPLYTLVREPSLPIRCPFQDAYHFSYNDLQHGFCSKRESFASPCASPSKYQLKFKHCEQTALYNGKDIELECLANWKDGSETYLYARLVANEIVSKDEKYRCFKYHHYGNDVTLAMSADATCRGLRSATDGPFLMEFSRDIVNSPPPSCHFPDWLKGATWRDMSGQNKYNIDESLDTIYRSHRRGGSSKDAVQSIYRCRRILTEPKSAGSGEVEELVVQTFSTHGCESSFECLKLKRLSTSLVAFHQGVLFEYDNQRQCLTEEFRNIQFLLPEGQPPTPCPQPGVHHTVPQNGCIHRLNVGCHNDTTIEIDHSCSAGQSGLILQCLVSWSENSKSYLMVRQKHDENVYCFSFRQEGESYVFGKEPYCSQNISSFVDKSTQLYSILRYDNCKTKTTTTTTTTTKITTTRPTTTKISKEHRSRDLGADSDKRHSSRTKHKHRKSEKLNDDDDEGDDDDDEQSGNGLATQTFRDVLGDIRTSKPNLPWTLSKSVDGATKHDGTVDQGMRKAPDTSSSSLSNQDTVINRQSENKNKKQSSVKLNRSDSRQRGSASMTLLLGVLIVATVRL